MNESESSRKSTSGGEQHRAPERKGPNSDLKALTMKDGTFVSNTLPDGTVRIEGWLQKMPNSERGSLERAIQKETRARMSDGLPVHASHGVPQDLGARGMKENVANTSHVDNLSYSGSFEKSLRADLKNAKAKGEGVYVVFHGRKSQDGAMFEQVRHEVYQGSRDKGVRLTREHTLNCDTLKKGPDGKETLPQKPRLREALGQDPRGNSLGINASENRRLSGGLSAAEWAGSKRPPQGTSMH